MRLTEILTIQFHYHAVVGFECVWEFTDKSGRKLLAGGNGIDNRMLSNLERKLAGFSKDEFYRQFKEGDVEDTLDVWRRPKR